MYLQGAHNASREVYHTFKQEAGEARRTRMRGASLSLSLSPPFLGRESRSKRHFFFLLVLVKTLVHYMDLGLKKKV